MAKKRVRQKQRMANKTLEGYEKQLLQEIVKWKKATRTIARGTTAERNAHWELNRYQSMHEHLRKYYFDL